MDDELNAEGADSGPVDEEEDDSDGGSIGDGAGGIGTAMRGDTSTATEHFVRLRLRQTFFCLISATTRNYVASRTLRKRHLKVNSIAAFYSS